MEIRLWVLVHSYLWGVFMRGTRRSMMLRLPVYLLFLLRLPRNQYVYGVDAERFSVIHEVIAVCCTSINKLSRHGYLASARISSHQQLTPGSMWTSRLLVREMNDELLSTLRIHANLSSM